MASGGPGRSLCCSLAQLTLLRSYSMNTNPYATPTAPDHQPQGKGGCRVAKALGTVMLLGSLIVMAYGAVAFWLIRWLPPNGGPTGRLPSLYVMGAGIIGAIVGLVVRDLRWAGAAKKAK